MTYEEIDEELADWGGDIYFVSMLPEFVWSQTDKRVAGYHEYSSPQNILQVYQTSIVDLGKRTLINYFEKQEVTEEDVIVFCINEEYYPKEKGNWIRITIIKKQNKKKHESRRDDTGKISTTDN